MFRSIAIFVLIATFLGIGVHCLAFPTGKEHRGGILRKLVHFFTLLFVSQKSSPVGVLKKLVYLLALLCFFVLAVTGFWPLLIMNKHIYGYFVMVHATFAPVFAICLAVLAVLWAKEQRFTRGDWPLLQRIVERVTLRKYPAEQAGGQAPALIRKITFWLVAALSLPLILSIVSSMFPLFGTYWQEVLLAAHRWTALAFAVVAIIHIYVVVRAQLRQ